MLQSILTRACLIGVLLLAPWLSANAKPSPVPRVVVSILPLKMLVDPLLPNGSATVLIPAGQSPHHFALKPSTMRALQSANLLIWIGPELETFLIPVFKTLPNQVTTMQLLPMQKHLLATRLQKNDPHHHSAIDPHIWLDPNIAITITDQIAAQLILLNPEYADDIQKRQQKLATEIAKVDLENQQLLTPVRDQPYWVYHNAYQYFESHYHLQPAQVIYYQPEVPLSLKRLSDLQKMAASEKTHCVLADPQSAKNAAAIFAGSPQIKVVVLDPLGGQGSLRYPEFLKGLGKDVYRCLRDRKDQDPSPLP